MDLLGERAGCLVHEPETDVVLADVFPPVSTEVAVPAGEVERNGDLLSLLDVFDVFADRDNPACRLVTEDVWRVRPVPEPVPVPLPAVPVGPTDTTADDLGDGTVRLRFGAFDFLYC